MEAAEVVAVLSELERAGVEAWVDGGWGIDALLGEQTRPHDDLDLVVALEDVPTLERALGDRGYAHAGGGAPMSFELTDAQGRQIDVHPVVFTDAGGVYTMRTGEQWTYPADGFRGSGEVLAVRVRCLTPEVQVLCHAGYDLDEDDLHDLRALRERFGVAVPRFA